MSIYLPIAEMSVNIWLLLGLGGMVGFLSGLFGVGGGFLMTPLLIFIGIPTAVAVGSEAAQIVASSASGAVAQWRRKNIDFKLGTILLLGGLVGAYLGTDIVRYLRRSGQFDAVVSITYVLLLGSVGTLMMIESLNAIRHTKAGRASGGRKSGQHNWIHGLPFKMRFTRSKLYISAIPPLLLGAFVGLLAAIMGVGGGFIMVPAMIYLLRVPTSVVVGTSLFQILFVTAAATILHATLNQTVDVVLAGLLMLGGAIGAQLGASAGEKLRGEQLRFLLAGLVLAVCLKIGWDLVATPTERFAIGLITGGGH